MRRSFGLIGVLTLWAGAAIAQSEPPISYSWAETASAQVAGQRLLGPMAGLYPHFSGPRTGHFSSGRLESVAFASKGRASGMEGMCEADIVWLSFRSDRETKWTEPRDGGAETAPVAIRSVRTETRYRAVADTAPRPWTEEYEDGIDAACAGQTDGWAFSRAKNAVDAWYAVRLQTILPDMAANEPAALLSLLKSCVGEGCTTLLPLFDQLRQAKFWSGEVAPCDALVDVYQQPRFRGPFCLTARYLLREIANVYEYLVVTARFEEALDANQDLVDPRLLEIRLRREGLIED